MEPPVRYAVVDVETSGLRADRHRVLQVGVVVVDADGTVIDRWSSLVRPRRRWWYRVGPTHVHGIRRREVRAAPPAGDVLHRLATTLEGTRVVAHNAGFDVAFLRRAAARARRPTAPRRPAVHAAPVTPARPASACRRTASATSRRATASIWCTPTMRSPTPRPPPQCSPTCSGRMPRSVPCAPKPRCRPRPPDTVRLAWRPEPGTAQVGVAPAGTRTSTALAYTRRASAIDGRSTTR